MDPNTSFSLKRIARHWVNRTLGHVHFTMDSQGQFTGPVSSPAALGNNWFLSHGFVLGYTGRWDYFHTQCVNSSDQVPGRANFADGSPAGFALGTYPTGAANTTISFVVGGNTITAPYLTDGSPLTFTADLGTGQRIGGGAGAYRINSRGTTANPNFSWADCEEHSLPWYHGSHIRAALVYHDVANTVREWQLELARIGNTANNFSSPGLLTTLGAATGGIARTAFTPAVADAGNYQVTTGGFSANTHRLDLRLYTPNTAYNELNQALLPMSAVFARSDAGGTLTSKPDGSRLGFSSFSRPGASAADWLGYATQSVWQSAFSALVIPGSRPRITLVFMLGHNVGAGEKSGDNYTATWVSNYVTLINRAIAAARAAFPTAEIIPLVIIPWRCTESGGVTTEAAARSIHARGIEVANAVGADWVSIPALFNFAQTMYFLHSQDYASAMRIYARIDAAMEYEANAPTATFRNSGMSGI